MLSGGRSLSTAMLKILTLIKGVKRAYYFSLQILTFAEAVVLGELGYVELDGSCRRVAWVERLIE